MKKKSTQIITSIMLVVITVLLNVQNLQAQQQTYKYTNSSGKKEGYNIARQDNQGITINFSVSQITTTDKIVDGRIMKNLSLISGVFSPNEAGAPDLPASMRYIAIPQGSKAVLKIVSTNTETIKNIDIAPAPVIPKDELDKIGVPLVYKIDDAIYSRNAFYPENPVILSTQKQIRGIDVVSLGISPFQYNPVTKDLIVYKDIQVEINFEGGNGHFGNDAYRNRWWDPILEDVIFNYNQLPVINYNDLIQNQKVINPMATGCEYAIIIPNDIVFSQWADSIKKFRTEQGILTNVYKLSDIGSTTVSGIKTWVTNAYNNWNIIPAAMLILADYGTNANSTVTSTTSPGFASDNYYADVTGDDLPDITFSRITANNTAQLQVMCSKFLNYERNPPTDPAFYDKPLLSLGWQDDRWYQLAGSIVFGYLKTFKNPVRVNALTTSASNTGNNVANAGIWSTTDPTAIINYFGPTGLNYIPAKPGTLGGFSGGTSAQINTAINNGAFMVLHRDHGSLPGWYMPSYSKTNISGLTNINNKLPFVFSINCNTGEYQNTTECFGEKFHRYTYSGQNSGALGVIAPSEVSYSFVNDIHMWGIFDYLWPNFMPAYGTTPALRDMRPAFANDAGKYFLDQSNWYPNAGSSKTATYQLYHTFGDAFQWIYSEVPKNLTVVHNPTIPSTATTFAVTSDAGSFIALTVSSPTGPIILGTATGTGSPVNITLAQSPTTNMLVTVTKQNYFRYGKIVTMGPTSVNDVLSNNFDFTCYPNPFSQSTTLSYTLGESSNVTLSVYNILGKEVAVIINNTLQLNGPHQVEFNNHSLPSGIYSCVLKTDTQIITKNLVIEE